MENYYRVMLGASSRYADVCRQAGFIGADFGIDRKLSDCLYLELKDFNKKIVPEFQEKYPEKSKVSAGLSCGFLYNVVKGIQLGDTVLCPDGAGKYMVGEISSDYFHSPGEVLPHRRQVNWNSNRIDRSDMSRALRHSTGSIGTISKVTNYATEIEQLIKGTNPPNLISTDESVDDPSIFALEKHLEDFLVENWNQTILSQNYDIYTDDGQVVGQQYPTDTGPIDILAISKDRKELLVIELKKGRASDHVVGQIQRYMGFASEELAEPNQSVKGIIIALEDDLRLKRSLSVTQNIEFYRYSVKFELFKQI